MRAHPASRQLHALPPAAWAHDESIGTLGRHFKAGHRLYGRSARAAPPQSAVRRGTFDLGAINLRGGRGEGADEARLGEPTVLKIARAGALHELDTHGAVGARSRAAESHSVGLPARTMLRTTVLNI
jgi:hypothetical protein